MVWGSIAGAAVNAGISKVFGGGKKGPSPQERIDLAQAQTYGNTWSSIKARVQAAEKWGYHPLYALGAPTVGGASATAFAQR